MKIRYHLGGNSKEQNFSIAMKEHAALFRAFWGKIVEELHENEDIKAFNNARYELVPISEDISARLRKHIERYVITEKI